MGGDVEQFRSYDSSRSTPSARSKRDRIAIHTFPFDSRTHNIVPLASDTYDQGAMSPCRSRKEEKEEKEDRNSPVQTVPRI
jgi:hypothetical protein